MTPYVQEVDFTLWLGDVREILPRLDAGSVDCCVTSPPYWALRDYGTDGQLGLETSPEEYVYELVAVFDEVRRLLTPAGTLWLNLGDSYASAWACDRRNVVGNGSLENGKRADRPNRLVGGLKEKDLVGIPWRVALALQADGWFLRSDIIWSKPNPMPESVTDRPTKAHEYVFLLSKGPRYWFDQEAVREPHKPDGRKVTTRTVGSDSHANYQDFGHEEGRERWPNGGRNIRSVWEIATQPYADAHFAVFPEELPRRCIAAACPEWVCGTCGKPRERIVEKGENIHPGDSGRNDVQGPAQRGKREDGKAIGTVMRERHEAGRSATTVGWTDCGHNNYRAGTVLDPFMGSGTTALVARRLGRRSVGVELNPEYAAMAGRRLQQLSLLAEGAA